jgi:hypothetical protein
MELKDLVKTKQFVNAIEQLNQVLNKREFEMTLFEHDDKF